MLEDLPYADESPAVQQRPPTMRRPGDRPDPADTDTDAGADDEPGRGPGSRPTPGGAADEGGATDGSDAAHATDAPSELSEEALAEASLIVANDVKALQRERDEYLDGLRRVQAEFENYRKRVIQQQADVVERAAEAIVSQLLPVLDACDAAVQHGADDVAPVQAQLLDTLTKQGLERLDPAGEAFDPNFHEAVMHEPSDDDGGEGGDGSAVVAEVLRTGYSWKGRVLRPAMVKVKG